MTIYLVVVQDRHTDDAYEAFTSRESAIEYAKEIASEYGYDRSSEEVKSDLATAELVGDFVYMQTTSCEGDCVSVHEVEVNQD